MRRIGFGVLGVVLAAFGCTGGSGSTDARGPGDASTGGAMADSGGGPDTGGAGGAGGAGDAGGAGGAGTGGQGAGTSGGGPDGGPADAGSGPAQHPSALEWSQTCAAYVKARCAWFSACHPVVLAEFWGAGAAGISRCETDFSASCSWLDGAPGITNEAMQAIIRGAAALPDVATLPCYALPFDYQEPFAPFTRDAPGLLPQDSPCFDTTQCGAGLVCSVGNPCGTCVPAKLEGEPCTTSAECGLVGDSKLGCGLPDPAGSPQCVVAPGFGEPCGPNGTCGYFLRCDPNDNTCGEASPSAPGCTDNVCAFPETAGAACDFSGFEGRCGGGFTCSVAPPRVEAYPGTPAPDSASTSYDGVKGMLVSGGNCAMDVANAAGNIVLCQRSNVGFQGMVDHSVGALALVIYNNVDTPFTPGASATFPVIAISKADGEALAATMIGAEVTVVGADAGRCERLPGSGESCTDAGGCQAGQGWLSCQGGTCTALAPDTCG